MLKFQPNSNNEKLMFIGLTFVVSYMLTKDLRNAILIVVISYLLNNILKDNLNSITKVMNLSKENFRNDDTSDEETDESEDEETDNTEENFSTDDSEEEDTDEETDDDDDDEED